MEILEQIAEGLINGDDQRVRELVRGAIEQRLPPGRILDGGLLAGMGVIGERFKCHEIYLPDVLLAARAMQAGMDELKPLLIREGVRSRGRVVLGSVQGDLHDIGKNLVGIMLRGAGFEVLDLGCDVAPERFVDAACEYDAPVIGMSALLTTTMPAMGAVVELLRQRGLSGRIRTIIGGAPVSARFAAEIGADAYGYDAANAVDGVQALLAGRGDCKPR